MKHTERVNIISVQFNEFSRRTQLGDQPSELQQQKNPEYHQHLPPPRTPSKPPSPEGDYLISLPVSVFYIKESKQCLPWLLSLNAVFMRVTRRVVFAAGPPSTHCNAFRCVERGSDYSFYY